MYSNGVGNGSKWSAAPNLARISLRPCYNAGMNQFTMLRASILVCVAPAALGFLLAVSAISSAQDGIAAKGSAPLVSLSGINSRIGKESYFLVKSAKNWTELWSRHAGTNNAERMPIVDFDTCMVAAVFSGKMINCRGVEAVELTENGREMILRFQNLTYQTVVTEKDRAEAKAVTPFGFFVVRDSAKPVALEKNVQQYLGMPPVWKEVARFPER